MNASAASEATSAIAKADITATTSTTEESMIMPDKLCSVCHTRHNTYLYL